MQSQGCPVLKVKELLAEAHLVQGKVSWVWIQVVCCPYLVRSSLTPHCFSPGLYAEQQEMEEDVLARVKIHCAEKYLFCLRSPAVVMELEKLVVCELFVGALKKLDIKKSLKD